MSRVPAYSRPAPVNQTPPVIVGSPVTGSTLTVTPGTYSNAPYTISRVWLRDGVATSETDGDYLLTSADLGSTITVQEIAGHAGGSSAPVVSAGVGPVTASSPIFPTTQTVKFGAKTLKGHGGHPLSYLGTGTLRISAGNGSGIWAIVANKLVPAGTFGNPAPTYASSYALTVTDGTYTSTVTVSMVDYEYSVASATELVAVVAKTNTTVNYGDNIRLRAGDYGGLAFTKASAYTQRAGGPAAPTWTTSMEEAVTGTLGWVTILPDDGATVTGSSRWFFNGATAWYIRLKGLALHRYNTNNPPDSYATTAVSQINPGGSWVWMDQCTVTSRVEAVTGGMCTGLRWPQSGSASNIFITDNVFENTYDGIYISGSNYWVVGNQFKTNYNDSVTTGLINNIDFMWNKVYNKVKLAGSHGDDYQYNLTNGSSISGIRIRYNMFFRGIGSPGAVDAQGFFMSNEGSMFSPATITGLVVEGNFIQVSHPNALRVVNAVSPIIRFNTVIASYGANFTTGLRTIICGGATATGGDVRFNIAEAYSLSGASTTTPNTTVNLSDGSYATTFDDHQLDNTTSDYLEILRRYHYKAGGPADQTIKHGAVSEYIDFTNRVASLPVV